LAGVIAVAVVWIITPAIGIIGESQHAKPTAVKPTVEAAGMETAPVETAAMETASVEPAGMEAAPVETAAMEAAKSTTMEATASVKPAAPTMRTSVSGARLAQRSSEQQSSCGSSQNLSHFGLNSFFA
jgi:hypothetical protein